jgi:DNA-binding XRE family transcriptional regulator
MAKNFRELYNKLPAKARGEVEAKVRESIRELTLAELRAAQEMTQEQLAKKLHVKQAEISKIEHRTDMYLSTLSDVIRGMGGELQLTAMFRSGDVHLVCLTPSRLPTARRQRKTTKRHAVIPLQGSSS